MTTLKRNASFDDGWHYSAPLPLAIGRVTMLARRSTYDDDVSTLGKLGFVMGEERSHARQPLRRAGAVEQVSSF